MFIRKLIRRHKHENESFRARMAMEHAAQENIDARLTRLELIYKNKTRTK